MHRIFASSTIERFASTVASTSASKSLPVKIRLGSDLGDRFARRTMGTSIVEELASDRAKGGSSSKSGSSTPLDFAFDNARLKTLIAGQPRQQQATRGAGSGGTPRRSAAAIGYWMYRDQRVQDNWALIYAQRLALESQLRLSVGVLQELRPFASTLRAFDFGLKGLAEVAKECADLNIGFSNLQPRPETREGPSSTASPTAAAARLASWVEDEGIRTLVVDMSPLRQHRTVLEDLRARLAGSGVGLVQVDAHNIVPVWEASDRQEKGAFTIRSKVMERLKRFSTEFPPVVAHPHGRDPDAAVDDRSTQDLSQLPVDRTVTPVGWAKPGSQAGLEVMADFVKNGMKKFGELRNDPNAGAQSDLSPWLNFGQVSAQRVLLYVRKHCDPGAEDVLGFVEQLTVRRELADNFCFYSRDDYDRLDGAPDWARKTLNAHRRDPRPHLYSLDQLEGAKTHDSLWNAAQLELLQRGKIHGYMRMYWAKMILGWTSDPEEALKVAIYLNDKYSLDGCDSNGYNGIMWSICGVHDKSFPDRPIFGQIRGMSYNGCTKKFDVRKYVESQGGKVPQGGDSNRSQEPHKRQQGAAHGGPGRSWKFNRQHGDNSASQAGDPDKPQQPVKVFVPSRGGRKDWQY